ncbi:response regulator transcription factor [Clostridium sp. P21]|uniref:Stage 0 sporulation protein A homolog n=1 Tax=Clostridium muellerianum TaxID=2716538 RepID=A0A7Y0EGJ7_9CLOT|nr:response regulator transcription factor [Clostridium muellerianum]NMM62992.1 response regulator transcription factor [Clostridium muellerianum]
MKRVLICDDDNDIIDLLELYLAKDNIDILRAEDGQEALDILKKGNIDICLLDVMMPKITGYQVMKKAKKFTDIPIIFITAKSDDNDVILGLDLGADDYIKKPFNPLEVAARVRAQLRRSHTNCEVKDNIIRIGDVELDTKEAILKVRNVDFILTSIEFKMLKYLMVNKGIILTKVQIFEEVWREDFITDDNIIMVYISKLREKIEENPKQPVYLKTIRGLGYKFEKQV